MSTQYRTVDTSTIAGLREAERLKANGWIIQRAGLFLVYLVKRAARP